MDASKLGCPNKPVDLDTTVISKFRGRDLPSGVLIKNKSTIKKDFSIEDWLLLGSPHLFSHREVGNEMCKAVTLNIHHHSESQTGLGWKEP